jgi:hypothetical protein
MKGTNTCRVQNKHSSMQGHSKGLSCSPVINSHSQLCSMLARQAHAALLSAWATAFGGEHASDKTNALTNRLTGSATRTWL